MDEHTSWIQFLPGYQNLKEWASHYLAREWRLPVFFTETHFTLAHVAISAGVVLLLILGALRFRRHLARSQEGRLLPPGRFGIASLFDLLTEATYSLSAGILGEKEAARYLPLIGTLVFFILFNNLIGLVPGFIPATETLKTNAAMALIVFLMTHVAGVRAHGMAYFKHFTGPVWYLAPLMTPIEIFSHIVRPFSLSLRLMGNMIGDHKVLATFLVLLPIAVPLPFYILGMLVSIVQTVVFALLSIVYIQMAVAHEEH